MAFCEQNNLPKNKGREKEGKEKKGSNEIITSKRNLYCKTDYFLFSQRSNTVTKPEKGDTSVKFFTMLLG